MHKKVEVGDEHEFGSDLAHTKQIGTAVIHELAMMSAIEIDNEPIDYLSLVDLESAYRATHDYDKEVEKCDLLTFRGEKISGLTGYNTTQPIYHVSDTGEPYFVMGVRMEEIDDEQNSRIEFFRADSAFSTQWDHIDDEYLPYIPGQDPSVTNIDGQLFFNVVEVTQSRSEDGLSESLTWETAFYKGQSIRELELFAYGPPKMKDIRVVELPTDEILTFTRPQSEDPSTGGRGQIGVVIADSIQMIKNPSILREAPLINTRFLPEEWGGINYGIALRDGKVGVIGHIARFDSDDPAYAGLDDKPKIYHPFSGVYDLTTRKITDIEILAMAHEFQGVIPKRDGLKDVAFGTGITEPNEDGDVMLLMGIGDAVTGRKMIKDPFLGLRLASTI